MTTRGGRWRCAAAWRARSITTTPAPAADAQELRRRRWSQPAAGPGQQKGSG